MARLQRVSPKDVPVHVIQRGNNRQVCFVADEDYGAYLGWLVDYAKRYSCYLLKSSHTFCRISGHKKRGVFESFARLTLYIGESVNSFGKAVFLTHSILPNLTLTPNNSQHPSNAVTGDHTTISNM